MGASETSELVHWVERSLDTILDTAAIAPETVLKEAQRRGLVLYGDDPGARLASLRDNDIAALDRMANSYIRKYTQVAGAQGFLTGLGGVVTLPVSVPTDVGAFLLLIARVNSAVMQTYGFESETEEGMTMLHVGLLAGLGIDKLTVVGANALVETLTKRITTKPYRDAVVIAMIRAVAKRVGVTLGKRHFAKAVPVIGGGINAGMSGGLVYTFGRRSKHYYRDLLAATTFPPGSSTFPAQPAEPGLTAEPVRLSELRDPYSSRSE
jgi:hypothetical protein